MKSNYKLGELIAQRREKFDGSDLPICGVTREGFIPPKQKDADTSLYNMFYLKDFVFNPARMELNSIVFNDKYDKAMCSSLYEVFYVIKPEIIMPEYLALIVKHDNFIRFCDFQGSGSAREYCRVANISNYPIALPSMDEQKRIVEHYNILTKRIKLLRKINENLEAQAQAVLAKQIRKSHIETTVDSLITLFDNMRKPMSSLERSGMERIYPYYGAAALMDYVDDYIFDGIYGLLGEDGTVMDENGYPIMQYVWGKFWVNNHAHIFQGKNSYSTELVYLLLKKTVVRNAVTGAVQLKINQENLRNLPILVPRTEVLNELNNIIKNAFILIRNNVDEISELETLKETLLSKMSD